MPPPLRHPKNVNPERFPHPPRSGFDFFQLHHLSNANRISGNEACDRALSSSSAHLAESEQTERYIMARKLLAALILGSSMLVAACNTVEGAGKDVQSAGKAVEKAAD